MYVRKSITMELFSHRAVRATIENSVRNDLAVAGHPASAVTVSWVSETEYDDRGASHQVMVCVGTVRDPQ